MEDMTIAVLLEMVVSHSTGRAKPFGTKARDFKLDVTHFKPHRPDEVDEINAGPRGLRERDVDV